MCSFTVDQLILVNNSYVTTFSDGTQLYTGTFKERLVNETTGKYINFNACAPDGLVRDRALRRTGLGRLGIDLPLASHLTTRSS